MSFELHSGLEFIDAVKSMNNFARISFAQTSIMTSKTTQTTTKTKKV